jgi:signal transduction histidine kinase
VPVEAVGRRKDGSEFAVEVVARRARLAVGRHRRERRKEARVIEIYTIRDIETRKQAEEARRRAADEAVAANRAKTEFLAAMSHELRTPLNAIIGFSEILKGEMFGALGNPKYRAYAQDIHGSGSHLLSIVNDILDMAKIEAGKVTLNEEDLDVASCCAAAVRLVAPRAKETAVPSLRGDGRLVKQLLANLLSNAAKFTPRGGTVTVSAALGTDGGVEIAVADTGIGIPADEIDKVVKPFYQVDRALSRRYEGTGLGLSLVKAFLEQHGGELELQSTVGCGTTAICRFPASRSVAVEAAAE